MKGVSFFAVLRFHLTYLYWRVRFKIKPPKIYVCKGMIFMSLNDSKEKIKTTIDKVIEKTKSEDCNDAFWDKADSLFLQALCLYIAETSSVEDCTLSNVLFMIPESDENSQKHPLDEKFKALKTLNSDSEAVKVYDQFVEVADKTRNSVYISSAARLKEFLSMP